MPARPHAGIFLQAGADGAFDVFDAEETMNAAAQAASAFRYAARAAGLAPSAIREILKVTESPDVISFAGGLPAPELFPVEDVALAAREVLAESGALQYSITEGYALLRQWICEHLVQTVRLRVSPDQVLVTHGSQQGLDLAARVLLDPGDAVVVENPAYLGALHAFRAYEANIVGLPTDAQGMKPDALRQFLQTSSRQPKLLYLIPNFQNPTGTSTSSTRGAELVQIAAEFGVPILEDDPYGRLRYEGADRPALAALSTAGEFIYLGTFSKILAPGLRVAWAVTPDRELYRRLVAAKQAADLHTATLTQRIVWRHVSRPGVLDAHITKLRSMYSKRRDTMLRALERYLPDGCTWTRPEGGLFLWMRLPEKIDSAELLKSAIRRKVAFVPGHPFWVGSPQRNTLRLNFSNASEERIEEGIHRFGETLKAAL